MADGGTIAPDWPLGFEAELEAPRPPPSNDAGRASGADDSDDAACSQNDLAWDFAAEVADEYAFDHTDRRWFRWDGSRWTDDTKESAFHRARVFCKERRDEGGPKELGRINTIAAVERAARTDPRLATSFEDWDRDPWSLGIPGGVVDLRTGQELPPDPTRRIRKSTSVRPADPGTPAPLWAGFLRDATAGDAALQAFLQRLAGYCLTGDVSEETLAFFYGDGGNGKGTFIKAVSTIMGSYFAPMPIEAFTEGNNTKQEYYRARMVGARLVTASEPPSGAVWSENQIKELTGNETPISARNPSGRVFEFEATGKLIFLGNHAPRLKGRTPAMERRLRVVPFLHKPAAVDTELKEKLRAEYPAILRWMLDGCLSWQRQKLGTAPAIQRATSSYFEQQDTFALWMAERCVTGETLSARPQELHRDLNAWRHASGEKPTNASDFRETIERTPGLRYATVKGRQFVRGLALWPEDSTPGNRGGPD